MRIIGGYLKGRRFKVPKNFHSRPTTDFAKEGLFNVLDNYFVLENKNVLDLCSGTGNISFEFVSRGAAKVTCVDSNYSSFRFIKQNATSLKITNAISIVKSDIIKFVKTVNKEYDFIFADPPYKFDKYHELINITCIKSSALNENGVFILEHGKDYNFESHSFFSFSKKYGNVYFSFFEKKIS